MIQCVKSLICFDCVLGEGVVLPPCPQGSAHRKQIGKKLHQGIVLNRQRTLARKGQGIVYQRQKQHDGTNDRITPDAVRLMKKLYHIDMEAEGQRSKLLSELPPVDGVVTMGCNVQCPALPCTWRENWGLDDPTGQPDAVFEETIRRIEANILRLRERLRGNEAGE